MDVSKVVNYFEAKLKLIACEYKKFPNFRKIRLKRDFY